MSTAQCARANMNRTVRVFAASTSEQGYAMLCYAMLCYAMLCYAMLCYAMLCYAMLCNIRI